MNPIEKYLAALRNSHPDMVALFTLGQCYNLFVILRTLYPQALPYYSFEEGHVYTLIGGRFYDIRGMHLKPPADLRPLQMQRGHKPHRWGALDRRRLK